MLSKTKSSGSNRVSTGVVVSRKTKKKVNGFRKVQDYQPKLDEITGFVSNHKKLLTNILCVCVVGGGG